MQSLLLYSTSNLSRAGSRKENDNRQETSLHKRETRFLAMSLHDRCDHLNLSIRNHDKVYYSLLQ